MKVIYKYGTGQEVPDDAIFLSTIVEVRMGQRFVWHYFLVEPIKESDL